MKKFLGEPLFYEEDEDRFSEPPQLVIEYSPQMCIAYHLIKLDKKLKIIFNSNKLIIPIF